jgi:3,4-dihydroxy 2-butanone 4-phosphate synthase/GTP cyclohydrolase II
MNGGQLRRRAPEEIRRAADGLADACTAWRSGACLVVLDDVSAMPAARLAFPAGTATADQLAFAIRHGSGFLSVALRAEDADRLDIPVMRAVLADGEVDVAVCVDAASKITTGISAADRARTVALLGSATSQASDLIRPGHVAVTRVKRRAGEPAGSVEGALLQLSDSVGHHPSVALVDLVGIAHPTQIADVDEGAAFAATHGLATCRVGALMAHLRRPPALCRAAEACVPGKPDIRAIAYRTAVGDLQHVAFIRGDVADGVAEVDVHVECRAATIFGPTVCRCGGGLDKGLARLRSQEGILLVLREATGMEGRMAGLLVDGKPWSSGAGGTLDSDRHRFTEGGASIVVEILADLGIDPTHAKAIAALAKAG